MHKENNNLAWMTPCLEHTITSPDTRSFTQNGICFDNNEKECPFRLQTPILCLQLWQYVSCDDSDVNSLSWASIIDGNISDLYGDNNHEATGYY